MKSKCEATWKRLEEFSTTKLKIRSQGSTHRIKTVHLRAGKLISNCRSFLILLLVVGYCDFSKCTRPIFFFAFSRTRSTSAGLLVLILNMS